MSVARGSADFDGSALRDLRANTPVDGRLLSAAALAARIGTSKSRILAYENCRSTPEPERIAQLAHVFQVPPARLSLSGKGEQSIRELRCQAGLTVAKAAAYARISRGTYRNIEQLAQLPVRDDGIVRIRLCDAFGIQLKQFNRALQQHPLAIARRTLITDHLVELFKRAYLRHVPAVVEADDARLLEIASLVQRPPSVVCRLVNAELVRYRQLLQDLARADVDAAYAQSESAASRAYERNRMAVRQIETGPSRSAHILIQFLTEAVNARQWRLMVALADAGNEGLPTRRLFELANDVDLWGLDRRNFLKGTQRNGRPYVSLTLRGIRTMRGQHELYACLYPRVATPGLADFWQATTGRPDTPHGLWGRSVDSIGGPVAPREAGRDRGAPAAERRQPADERYFPLVKILADDPGGVPHPAPAAATGPGDGERLLPRPGPGPGSRAG